MVPQNIAEALCIMFGVIQAQAKAEREKAAKEEAAVLAARAAAAADAQAAEEARAAQAPQRKKQATQNMLKGARMAFAANPPGALPKITFSKVNLAADKNLAAWNGSAPGRPFAGTQNPVHKWKSR